MSREENFCFRVQTDKRFAMIPSGHVNNVNKRRDKRVEKEKEKKRRRKSSRKKQPRSRRRNSMRRSGSIRRWIRWKRNTLFYDKIFADEKNKFNLSYSYTFSCSLNFTLFFSLIFTLKILINRQENNVLPEPRKCLCNWQMQSFLRGKQAEIWNESRRWERNNFISEKQDDKKKMTEGTREEKH